MNEEANRKELIRVLQSINTKHGYYNEWPLEKLRKEAARLFGGGKDRR